MLAAQLSASGTHAEVTAQTKLLLCKTLQVLQFFSVRLCLLLAPTSDSLVPVPLVIPLLLLLLPVSHCLLTTRLR